MSAKSTDVTLYDAHLRPITTASRTPDDLDRFLGRLEQAARAHFKSAESNRATHSWSAFAEDINTALNREQKTLRARSRWIHRNTEYGSSAKNHLLNYIVGTGFDLQARVTTTMADPSGQMVMAEDEAVNDTIELLWGEYSESVTVNASELVPDSMEDVQEMILERWVEDGECFMRLVVDLEHPVVPFAVQFIDPEWLNCYRTQAPNGNPVFMGIEVEAGKWKPVAYWVTVKSENPREFGASDDFRIPAGEMVHVFEKMYSHQLRGVPFTASVQQSFYNMTDYTDAQVIRSKIAAMFGVIFEGGTKGSLPRFVDDTSETRNSNGFPEDANGNPISQMKPGMMGAVPEGVTPHLLNPTAPESAYGDFLRSQLTAMGAGIRYGMSYTGLTRDTKGTTFAGGRQAENMDFQGFRRFQKKFARKALTPLFRKWMDVAHLSGALSLQGYTSFPGARHYQRHEWMSSGWTRGINPLQEVNASVQSMEAGITTLADECALLGKDWKQQLRVQKRIQMERERLGLAAPSVAQPTDQPDTETDEEEVQTATQEESQEFDAAGFKTKVDAYGVAVRAGAITPQPADEQAFRSDAGLPEMSGDVSGAWTEDGGTRRPITLVQPGGGSAPAAPIAEDEEE